MNKLTLKPFFLIALLLMSLGLLQAAEEQEQKEGDAEQAPPDPISYFLIEPDIVTNFVKSKSKRLGFINVQVQLAVKESRISSVEKHQPIIEDALVMYISSQSEDKIKSLEGRKELQTETIKLLNDLLKEEMGEEIIEDVLFTKYMWQ